MSEASLNGDFAPVGPFGPEWTQVTIGDRGNAVWFDYSHPAPVDVTVTCSVCGHSVTLRQGDAPIPAGDPRLCEHF
jgi:hypothetical protein